MEHQEEDIKLILDLTLEEVNVIMHALSQRPFHEVYELIGKINQQASEQLSQNKSISENKPKLDNFK